MNFNPANYPHMFPQAQPSQQPIAGGVPQAQPAQQANPWGNGGFGQMMGHALQSFGGARSQPGQPIQQMPMGTRTPGAMPMQGMGQPPMGQQQMGQPRPMPIFGGGMGQPAQPGLAAQPQLGGAPGTANSGLLGLGSMRS